MLGRGFLRFSRYLNGVCDAFGLGGYLLFFRARLFGECRCFVLGSIIYTYLYYTSYNSNVTDLQKKHFQ